MRALLLLLLPVSIRGADGPPPDMVAVAGGTFQMGRADGDEDERPPHPVTLSPFLIDRHEVRARDYQRCVEAGRCRAPRRPIASPEAAAVWVSWTDAADYCRFAGRRLPTEAEWERAARGPVAVGPRFPWGDDPDCARANFGNYRGEGLCPSNPGAPVAPGSNPSGASAEGVHDLAGNVMEWVADWYEARHYGLRPAKASRDPKGPARGTRRVLRGGACCSMFGLPRTTDRIAFPPDYADEDIGFRCARDAPRGRPSRRRR